MLFDSMMLYCVFQKYCKSPKTYQQLKSYFGVEIALICSNLGTIKVPRAYIALECEYHRSCFYFCVCVKCCNLKRVGEISLLSRNINLKALNIPQKDVECLQIKL